MDCLLRGWQRQEFGQVQNQSGRVDGRAQAPSRSGSGPSQDWKEWSEKQSQGRVHHVFPRYREHGHGCLDQGGSTVYNPRANGRTISFDSEGVKLGCSPSEGRELNKEDHEDAYHSDRRDPWVFCPGAFEAWGTELFDRRS